MNIKSSLNFTAYLKETDRQSNNHVKTNMLVTFKNPFAIYLLKSTLRTIFRTMIRMGGQVDAHKPNRISHLLCLASNDHVIYQTIIYSNAELSLHLNHELLDIAYLTKEIQRISREE